MNHETLLRLLNRVATGELPAVEAADSLTTLTIEDIDYAHIDHHRSLRKGFPEVIFGEGKTAEQIIGIMKQMVLQEEVILVTRLDSEKGERVHRQFPNAVYHPDARMLVLEKKKMQKKGKGEIVVVSAGTSDIPVAREAYLTADAMGNPVTTVFDVGVAGIHRLLNHKSLLEKAAVLIVVAGMEGALPSVVAGLVKSPVIAVPTSVGYGVSLGGLTALFSMLNSCSSNVAVVNIDNGFGAGYMASAINQI
jgi:pyridinium-3,5-biscarboxylic acid mononucleotide synthase